MPKKIIALMIALWINSVAADPWTKEDTVWQATYLALHLVDWWQTLDITSHCDETNNISESNVILGRCPSPQRVHTYFISTALAHTGIAHVLEDKHRRLFQLVTILVEISAVNNNRNSGVELEISLSF